MISPPKAVSLAIKVQEGSLPLEDRTSFVYTSHALSPHEVLSFQFPALSKEAGLRHAVYTRRGGVSQPPYDNLNTSYSVGDEEKHVTTNLLIIQQSIEARHLLYMNQVHGTHVLVLDREEGLGSGCGGKAADAVITNLSGVALMVKQADCQAVILFDPEKRVIANVHCGWRGNRANLLGKVIDRMRTSFGTSPGEMRAAIGPSLGPCCAEFTSYRTLFPESFRPFMVSKNHFDLWGISLWQLLEAGVRKEKIEVARICTRCRTDLFFSYRGEGTTGRFATVVMLE
jgi:YfiH family protein